MTKKAKYKIILQVIAVLIIIVCWWFLPYKCLNETSIDEILYIEIAYGANGSVKRIENREQINYIVEPIKASRLQKEKLSLGYVGIDIWIAFYNKENLNPDIHGASGIQNNNNNNMISVPEGVDADMLMKVLGNPEMAALLTSLAKSMKG